MSQTPSAMQSMSAAGYAKTMPHQPTPIRQDERRHLARAVIRNPLPRSGSRMAKSTRGHDCQQRCDIQVDAVSKCMKKIDDMLQQETGPPSNDIPPPSYLGILDNCLPVSIHTPTTGENTVHSIANTATVATTASNNAPPALDFTDGRLF